MSPTVRDFLTLVSGGLDACLYAYHAAFVCDRTGVGQVFLIKLLSTYYSEDFGGEHNTWW